MSRSCIAWIALFGVLAGAGEALSQDVSFDIGTVPPGESLTITFQVTVDHPFPSGVEHVANQGVVSGGNFDDVLTDDPDTPDPDDPTVSQVIPPVAVELSSFDVTSHDGLVTIVWETGFEENHLGFHVLRGEDDRGAYERLTDELLRSDGQTSFYEFVDDSATPGRTYRYAIEAQDLFGGSETFELQSVMVAGTLPKRLALHRNRPNPFNPSTTIVFELPEAGRAILRIYDVRGRMVRTLVDGDLPHDTHVAEWDGRDDNGLPVGSGVYIYRLQFGTTVETQKMVLMK